MKITELLFRVFIQPAFGCFLRAEEGMAKNAANTAAATGATLGGEAAGELSSLSPFYSREMQAEHSLDPTQTNEMLTAAGAGIGGATGAAQAGLERQAATTGNAAGQAKSLQELARDKMKAGAGVSEDIASQDVLGAQKLRQEGAAGEAGLYGENLKGQLDAMGQVSGDVNAATNASKTGWLQNAEGVAKDAASIVAMFCWIAAEVYGGWDNPRVSTVRNYLLDWADRSFIGKLVVKAYVKFGERVAKLVKASPMLKSIFHNLFERIQ